MIVENFLLPKELSWLHDDLTEGEWQEFPLGGSAFMAVCDLKEDIKLEILTEVEKRTGKQLEVIAMYGRYNCPDLDNSFRVHSDGSIGSQEPSLASVLYLTTGDTGTALLEHPEHGSEGKGLIFTEDDGKWEVVEYCPEVENSCFIYDANKFHSRWPWQAQGHRFVVVGFYKERDYC